MDYFRHKDESSDDDSERSSDEDEEKGDYVSGGVYAPAASQSISIAAAGLTMSIVVAAGIKNLMNSNKNESDEGASTANSNADQENMIKNENNSKKEE